MFKKIWIWFFGASTVTTAAGIVGGAAIGAGTVAATGNFDTKALAAAAITGALSASAGAAGRVVGEPKPKP